jgi:hypothetical protein
MKQQQISLTMKYGVIDNTNHFVKSFDSWRDAFTYIGIANRLDWKIVTYNLPDFKSTDRQRAAVRFCKAVLRVDFDGNIKSWRDCRKFLSEYLELAQKEYNNEV